MSLQWNMTQVGGHLARKPEIRTISTDKAVCNFAVAVNRSWKNAKGERQEEATFIECQAWNKLVDFVAGHFDKGEPIFVTGFLRQENWKDKDSGDNRSRLVLVVEEARFVESKEKPAAAAGGAA